MALNSRGKKGHRTAIRYRRFQRQQHRENGDWADADASPQTKIQQRRHWSQDRTPMGVARVKAMS